MSNRKLISGLSLIVSSFLLTGCYTQLQSMEYSERASKRGIHSSYYSWNGDNEKEKGSNRGYTDETKVVEKFEDDSTANLPVDDFYYKDYQTEQWYEDNYADRIYWQGYDDGFDDGYDSGFDDGYEVAYDDIWFRYQMDLPLKELRYRNHYRWGLGVNYYGWSFGYNSFYANYHWNGTRYPYWGFDPFWDPYYYGGWGYHHSPYRNYIVVYNDYHQSVDRSRSNTHYNGPRSTGLVSKGNGNTNAGISRTRSTSDNVVRSKNTGRTRTSGIVNTGRTRTSSTSGTRYTGRTNSTTSRSSGTVRTNRTKSSGTSVNTGRTRSQNVSRTNGTKTRSSGVTNRSRGKSNTSSVRSNSTSRTRSSGVRTSGNSGSNSRSVQTTRSSGRSSGSSVRSNSGSSRTRSSGSSGTSTKRKTRRGGGN